MWPAVGLTAKLLMVLLRTQQFFQADKLVREKFEKLRKAVELLSKPMSELQSSILRGNGANIGDLSAVTVLHGLMEQIGNFLRCVFYHTVCVIFNLVIKTTSYVDTISVHPVTSIARRWRL